MTENSSYDSPCNFKKTDLRFVPGNPVLPKSNVNLDNFPSVPSWQILKLGEGRINKEHTGGCQCGAVWR